LLYHAKINQEAKQINYLDSRAYTEDQVNYFPSVTTILGIIDKGANYNEWLKNNGRNADYLTQHALEVGQKVHNLIDLFNRNIPISNVSSEGGEIYSKEVWTKIDRYIDYYRTVRPTILATECSFVCNQFGYGGTIDKTCVIDNQTWLVDYKTGNEYPEHELQLAAYKVAWNLKYPEHKLDKAGILYLDALTKGAARKGNDRKQGVGWKLEEIEITDYLFDTFMNFFAGWKWKNPDWKPLFLTLPSEFSKEKIDEEIKTII
jgi:hypothetical protein